MSSPFHAVRGRAHISKHRQFDHNGKHIPGDCRVLEGSGLRKLMRAARRGKLPAERLGTIKRTIQSIAERIPLGYSWRAA